MKFVDFDQVRIVFKNYAGILFHEFTTIFNNLLYDFFMKLFV